MGMMEQYRALQAAHPETVLLFRMGDFYELFDEDAEQVAPRLGLTVTSREKNTDHPLPMAGFPWHALEGNVRKLLALGHKVTVAEQEETVRPGEKLLCRVVTRVYTPGSIYEESLLEPTAEARLAALVVERDRLGLAVLDSSTGIATAREVAGPRAWEQVADDLLREGVAELVLTPRVASRPEVREVLAAVDELCISVHGATAGRAAEALSQALGGVDPGYLDLDARPLARRAVGVAVDYLQHMHVGSEVRLQDVRFHEQAGVLELDRTTLRNLELIRTADGSSDGTLLSVMDETCTAMGRRSLRAWLLAPLLDLATIKARSAAVGTLVAGARPLRELREALALMHDLERLASRLASGHADARDLVAMSDALRRASPLEAAWSTSSDPLLAETATGLAALDAVAERIAASLDDEPPASVREGGLFRAGSDARLDAHRARVDEGHRWLEQLEATERERLGIPSLKVRHHKTLGYVIEVTKTHLDKVPPEYVRRQAVATSARFTTDALLEWQEVILSAAADGHALEHALYLELCAELRPVAGQMSEIARRLATLDVLATYAEVARRGGWTAPVLVNNPDVLELTQARHPVLAADPAFVPNDLRLDSRRGVLLLTGPNMGGKSTYLRQTALLTILAQAGAWVPARSARIGLADRILTRVGAHDDLRRGRSTFMVEMLEVAHILRRATASSLVILDEVGRGTSTFDGVAIAWAVVEDLARRVGARTLFATHYHQLVGLEDEVARVANVHVQVDQGAGELRFLHTVADGPSDESLGVQVAALAGLPAEVVERAGDLLEFLERQAAGARAGERGQPGRRTIGQRSLFGFVDERAAPGAAAQAADPPPQPSALEALERLQQLDPDALSPREALEAVHELTTLLRGRHELLRE